MGTVLLTGATGFLGSHLLKALLALDYQVVIIKRSSSDLSRIRSCLEQVHVYDSDLQSLSQPFAEHPISTIIHTACHYGRGQDEPFDVVATNLIFGLELLQHAKKHGVARFINIDTSLERHLNAYTLSKKQFVEWLQRESAIVQCVNLRLEHMYGPGDDNKKFLPWLIEQLANSVPSIDLTAGEQLRDFIYIDDVVSALLLLMRKADALPPFCTFDVASGNLTSVKSFVQTVKRVYETTHGQVPTALNFGAIAYRSGEQMQVQVDNSALFALGWTPQESLESGIKKTLEEI